MDYKEKIKQLIDDRKINSEQAVILLNALKESEKRREKIFLRVLSQRKNREKKLWKFLSVWISVIIVSLGSFIYIGNLRSRFGRDTYKALDYFDQASIYLERQEHQEAIRYIKKGIEQAPRFPLGYVLLGSTYRVLYEKTKDNSIKDKEIEAFKKTKQLKEESSRRRKMNTASILFAFIFLILVLGTISIIILVLYNRLVKHEEEVNEAWAQAGTLYQRKLDLIPALLEAAKNYAQHEKQTFQAVTEARAIAQQAIEGIGDIAFSDKEKLNGFLESQGKLSLGIGKLFALVERYPDLKANTHFLTIQQQLVETEGRITREREIYNNRVRGYNSTIRYFPANLIAGLFNFEKKEYFKLEEKSI